MALQEYRRKRHFEKTPEPGAEVSASRTSRLYIIQKHAASHLHYDFRLELDGVLKSWAVPKGPSLDPADKRLAVHVEDHPVAYGSFEGVIPAHEYGGGTVMLWDRGEWEPAGDAAEMYARGRLKFRLRGQKLRGGWTLVRMPKRDGTRENWLLIKEKDSEARPAEKGDILTEKPLSVATQRPMERIAADSDRTWTSQGELDPPVNGAKNRAGHGSKKAKGAVRSKSGQATSTRDRPDPSGLTGARRAAQPDFVTPQLAMLVKDIPTGEGWLHEVKFDGYRILAVVEDGQVGLMTRRKQDWTHRFPAIAEAVGALPIDRAILDGELVVLQAGGISSFQAMQNALKDGSKANLVYYRFDLPYYGGYDLTGASLRDRKELLHRLLASPPAEGKIRFSDHIVGEGGTVLEHACRLGLEGVICKRVNSPYESARTPNWLKVKCSRRQEFVIGGYTQPSGARRGFGALLLGYHDEPGRLRYCGKVGTGFDAKALQQIHKQLVPLEIDRPPFFDPPRGAEARGAHWIRPRLVAEIEFTEWTDGGHLRHPSFQGLREDKLASEVIREEPQPMPDPKLAVTSSRSSRNGRRPERSAAHQEIAGIALSHPDRVVYPEQGLTKGRLAEYYQQVAEWILPHLLHRPLTLVRCPDGQGKKCFYQKHPGMNVPGALRTIPIIEKSKTEPYFLVDNLAGLISLVQMGVLEIHVWGSQEKNVDKPDRIIFDLDPGPEVSWPEVIDAALLVRDFMSELKLTSFVKTSGGKGLHVVVPVAPRQEWEAVKAFAKDIATALAGQQPAKYLAVMSKSKRTGKIFVDYLRNGRGATSVAPYSTRARPGAPVSTPIRWEELKSITSGGQFTIGNLWNRLKATKRDPWEGFFDLDQRLPKSR